MLRAREKICRPGPEREENGVAKERGKGWSRALQGLRTELFFTGESLLINGRGLLLGLVVGL